MPLNVSRSIELFEKSRRFVPSSTQTFSKGWTQYPFGVSPIFLEKADGCFVWDVDGNKFIDWPMALGPVLLGHNHKPVNAAVKKQIDNGVAFSLPHFKEIELAEALCDIIPCAEMVKFGKNGSDATSGAVRVARAHTGREMIACCGYHGWQDWYIGTTTRNLGVPRAVKDQTRVFEYNDPGSLQKLFDEHPGRIACVILEPVTLVSPQEGFLEKVNRIAHQNGALVIYDECWTGFRWAPGGAQEFFEVTPDLACFGKALGNGFPISAIVGGKDVMALFDEVFFSFTFGGDMVGIAAALAVLEAIETTGVIGQIWRRGERLIEGFNRVVARHGLQDRVSLAGYPPKTFVSFRDEEGKDDLLLKTLVQQEMIKRNSLYAGYHVLSLSHGEDEVSKLLDDYDEIFSSIKADPSRSALENGLEGKLVVPVFRASSNVR
jgi:glutamate-1-semialdehyde aminotransferase